LLTAQRQPVVIPLGWTWRRQPAACVATLTGWCGLDTAPSPLRVMPSHSRPIYKQQPRDQAFGTCAGWTPQIIP
jgi:hypothetical protein